MISIDLVANEEADGNVVLNGRSTLPEQGLQVGAISACFVQASACVCVRGWVGACVYVCMCVCVCRAVVDKAWALLYHWHMLMGILGMSG